MKGSEFQAIINRDLTRRVRTTNGITAHKAVAQNDLKMATKLAATMDKKLGLYGTDEQPEEDRIKDIQLGVDLVGQSKNPLVRQAKNVLMDVDADEISPEEEELLHRSGGQTNGNSEEKAQFQRDETILKALDMLVVYLRIVHSIDFYGHLDYPNEDNMPSRYFYCLALPKHFQMRHSSRSWSRTFGNTMGNHGRWQGSNLEQIRRRLYQRFQSATRRSPYGYRLCQ